MKYPSLTALLAIAPLCFSPVASAQVLMTGDLTATKACPALSAIRKPDTAPPVNLSVGEHYSVVAKNSANATHYLVNIPDAKPNQRWVALDCGTLAGSNTQPPTHAVPNAAASNTQGIYVFALSWQAAFCEGASSKAECRSQNANRFDATHFTLHGLWPNRAEYCNVPAEQRNADIQKHWNALPEPALSSAFKARLAESMPGTQSFLERHEWTKHGTCYGAPAEQYFGDALNVLDQINKSPVQALFAANIGKTVTNAQIRGAFDQAFGNGVGERVRVSCKDDGARRLIGEITLGLNGNPHSDSLATAALAARPTDAGCPEGIVDPVGLQ